MSGPYVAPSGWRVVDIVVAAVLAVAFGAVFQGWNLLWSAAGPASSRLANRCHQSSSRGLMVLGDPEPISARTFSIVGREPAWTCKDC